jgi:phosphatidylglycerophosphatase A
MVGVWISRLAVPADGHWGNIAGAFVLFRLFDIVKPLGVRRMERIGGGWGVMLDDILAGVYGAIVLFFINMLLQ